MSEPFVIVGGGLAAATAAVALRDNGYDGRLVVHCAERHLPYERPPLSKGYLAGEVDRGKLFPNPAEWYAENDVELLLGSRVDELDPRHRMLVAGGRSHSYDRLLLAMGSAPRRLPDVEATGAPVTYLRTIEDSDRIKQAMGPGRRVAIIGGGFLGLEVAATARSAGTEVTVIEAQDQPLVAVLGREVGQLFAELHREHGVDVRLGARVGSVERSGQGAVVRLADGSEVSADLLVVGIGAPPDTLLAQRAGLAVDNGVVVDDRLRSSDPRVFAAGDIANAWHPGLGRYVRVEHWDNAKAQGAVAARNMLGHDVAHDQLPYFFTDQYDLGMEYVGYVGPEGYDEVVLRGDVPGRVFDVLWVREGRVAAAMQVNDWDSTGLLRRLVGARGLDLEALRDPAVPLDELVRATQGERTG